MKLFSVATVVVVFAVTANAQNLNIDFNSTSQDGGPTNNEGFQAYDAGHEVAEDFDTKSYSAFGTMVGVTPDWPNTTDNRVRQMIDRGAGNDANWMDSDLAGVTDWLGIDTRTGNGGNGNWDGTDGTPTYMTLTLSGLPENEYSWTGFHQDTENVHGNFAVWLSTDGGATFAQLADGYMSDSSPGGNPESATLVTDFAGMTAAGSLYATTFDATGSDDVVLQFAPYAGSLGDAVHNQIWGINGFQLSVVPEPSGLPLMLLGVVALLGCRHRIR